MSLGCTQRRAVYVAVRTFSLDDTGVLSKQFFRWVGVLAFATLEVLVVVPVVERWDAYHGTHLPLRTVVELVDPEVVHGCVLDAASHAEVLQHGSGDALVEGGGGFSGVFGVCHRGSSGVTDSWR